MIFCSPLKKKKRQEGQTRGPHLVSSHALAPIFIRPSARAWPFFIFFIFNYFLFYFFGFRVKCNIKKIAIYLIIVQFYHISQITLYFFIIMLIFFI